MFMLNKVDCAVLYYTEFERALAYSNIKHKATYEILTNVTRDYIMFCANITLEKWRNTTYIKAKQNKYDDTRIPLHPPMFSFQRTKMSLYTS